MPERIAYGDLNSRQKENYNFQKVAAQLADYGFDYLRLTDDWEGTDFLACHIDAETVLKVHLKGRLSLDRKYVGKNIHIAFLLGGVCPLYPHDPVLERTLAAGRIGDAGQRGLWEAKEIRSWPRRPAWARETLEEYRV